jgi:CubicO group peptidase (beta-lactamase class C family)
VYGLDKQFSLPRSQPEMQGIASDGIKAFIESIEANHLELHSFMLLRHGYVVAEGWWDPYTAKLPHMLFSLSKSFTSTAIGLAVAEGILTLDDQVISFFPDEVPSEITANLAAMQIRHLLMMGTGHAVDTMDFLWKQEEGNWVRAFFDVPVEYAPGTHFVYNTGATYMLSAILQKASNQRLLDYLKPRLLEPLNILNATWAMCPRGIHTGGFGLNITTEDIAKFGQLYLQKGIWNGEQLLPAAWVEEATSKQISNGEGGASDWTQGYGYQFWRSQHEAYRGDGAFGQYCIVLPEQDAIIAITSGLNDMQAVLNEVWNILLPAMKSEALALNEFAAASLQAVLNNLKLVPPQLQHESAREAALSGQIYSLEVNKKQAQTFSIRFEANEAAAVFSTPYGESIIRLGRGEWLAGASRVNEAMEEHKFSSFIYSSFTWRDDATLEITVRYIETPFYHTMVCRFEGEDILLERSINVSLGPTELEQIRGKLVRSSD